MSKDTPLQVKIEGDELLIRIGIDTLAFAVEHCPEFYDYDVRPEPPYVKVTDKMQLANDILLRMLAENEIGETPISDFFDRVTLAAWEDGSLGFEIEED